LRVQTVTLESSQKVISNFCELFVHRHLLGDESPQNSARMALKSRQDF
jgi:hypothetical protein